MRNKRENSNNSVNHETPNANGYVLRLFVTGATPNSIRAVSNIRQICEAHLKGNYSLEIVDVYQQHKLAAEEQLIALPLLIKKSPLPERRLIGDMSDTQKVLKGLGLLSNQNGTNQ